MFPTLRTTALHYPNSIWSETNYPDSNNSFFTNFSNFPIIFYFFYSVQNTKRRYSILLWEIELDKNDWRGGNFHFPRRNIFPQLSSSSTSNRVAIQPFKSFVADSKLFAGSSYILVISEDITTRVFLLNACSYIYRFPLLFATVTYVPKNVDLRIP